MNKTLNNLIELIKENPDLPVIPMTWGEVCQDCERYWMGSLSSCEIDEYVCYDEIVWFKSQGIEELENIIANEEFGVFNAEEIEKRVTEKINSLEWQKAIVVWIELPDML